MSVKKAITWIIERARKRRWCVISSDSNSSNFGSLEFPLFSGKSDFVIHQSQTQSWGKHTPSRTVVERALKKSASRDSFISSIIVSIELAKSVLAVPDSLPIITLQYSLNSESKKQLCALAVGSVLHHIEFQKEPNELHIVDRIMKLLGAQNSGDLVEKVQSLIERAGKRTLRENLGMMALENDPSKGEPVWLIDNGTNFDNKRTILMSTGSTSLEKHRAFLIGVFGLSQVEATKILSDSQGSAKTERTNTSAEKFSLARLLLAAGEFPQPGTWAESRR